MSDQEYRTQVQGRIQDLLTGNRPRNLHLSTVSTGRLILEGVVEEIRIYRLQKQEKLMEAREYQGRAQRGERHRDRSRERHQHRHRHRDCSGERHHRHRTRSRDRDRDKPRQRHHDQSRRRNKSCKPREIPDPVTEGQPDNDPDFMMTGGAGPATTPPLSPANTLPPTTPHLPNPIHAEFRHRKPISPPIPPSVSHPRDPDNITPLSSLPLKAAGIGFAAHVWNTYRHIKAEHESGLRSRGFVERRVDGWRGKGLGVESKGGRREGDVRERGRKIQKEADRGNEGITEARAGFFPVGKRPSTPYAVRDVPADEALPLGQVDTDPRVEGLAVSDGSEILLQHPGMVSVPDDARAALLSDIQRSVKLRRVRSLGGEDEGGVEDVYESTAHSRDVEAKERRQEEEGK